MFPKHGVRLPFRSLFGGRKVSSTTQFARTLQLLRTAAAAAALFFGGAKRQREFLVRVWISLLDLLVPRMGPPMSRSIAVASEEKELEAE